MKNFLYSMVCLSALAFTFSACSEDNNDDQNGGGNGNTTDPVQLTTPAVTATGGEGQFTAQWAAVENATSYTVQYGDKEEKTTETTITKIVAAGDYTIRVKATTDKAGYIDSEWGEATVTVEEAEGISDGTWYGTWTVKSTHAVTFSEGMSGVQFSYDATPKEFEITLEPTEMEDGSEAVLVSGWSLLVDGSGVAAPGVAFLEDGTNNLQIMAGLEVGTSEDGTVKYTWVPFCDLGGQYSFVTGAFPAITFAMMGDNATGTCYSGKLDNGGTFAVKCLDVFGVSAQNQGIYILNELPVAFPAGEFTMVKTANASQAPEKAFVKEVSMPNLLDGLKSERLVRASVYAAAVR